MRSEKMLKKEKMSHKDMYLALYAAGLRAREHILNGKEGEAYRCLLDAMRRCDRAELSEDEEETLDYEQMCIVMQEAHRAVRDALMDEDWDRAMGAMQRGDRLYIEMCDRMAEGKAAKMAGNS